MGPSGIRKHFNCILLIISISHTNIYSNFKIYGSSCNFHQINSGYSGILC